MRVPDLSHGAGSPPPPAEEEGDRRPDRPDWRVVLGLILVAFGLVAIVEGIEELAEQLGKTSK